MKTRNQGIIIFGSNLVSFVLWKLFEQVENFLSQLPENTRTIIELLFLFIGCYSGYLIYQGIKIERNHRPDPIKYHNHLKILMDSINECLVISDDKPTLLDTLGNEQPKKNEPDYYYAIKKSPKKMAIIQHLITDISNPANESPELYLTFSLIQTLLKDKESMSNYGNWRIVKEGFIPNFNRDFNHVFNSVYDGEPIFGACDGCIDFYTGRNYEKIRNVLDNTGKEPHEWYYSLFD